MRTDIHVFLNDEDLQRALRESAGIAEEAFGSQ